MGDILVEVLGHSQAEEDMDTLVAVLDQNLAEEADIHILVVDMDILVEELTVQGLVFDVLPQQQLVVHIQEVDNHSNLEVEPGLKVDVLNQEHLVAVIHNILVVDNNILMVVVIHQLEAAVHSPVAVDNSNRAMEEDSQDSTNLAYP